MNPRRNNKRTGKVGEAVVNENIDKTARISHGRNKTNNISPSEWNRGHRETNTAQKHR